MFLAMKGRHRGPVLLPETKGEWGGYFVGIVLAVTGLVFFLILSFSQSGQIAGVPHFFVMHPILWFLIGIASFFSGTKIVVMTHRRQAKRTKESKAAVTGAMH